MFQLVQPQVLDHRRWPGFATSWASHGLMILVLFNVSWPGDSSREALPMRVYSMEPLTLRLPDTLYTPPGPKGKASRKAGTGRKEGSGAPPAPSGGGPGRPAGPPGDNPAQARGPRTPRRRFELPEMKPRTDTGQTLLQLSSPPDVAMARQVPLPTMMFWSQNPTAVPKPKAKPFILPGRPAEQRPATQALLDAPPRLEPPNLESRVSSLKIASSAIKENPALPRPPGTTMPIRVFQPPPAKTTNERPVIDIAVGDPINVLATSQTLSAQSPLVSIPGGNQIGTMPSPPADDSGSLGGQGGGGGTGTSAQAGTGRPGTGGGGGGSGGSSSQGFGSGSGGKGVGQGSGGQGTGIAGDGSANGYPGGLGGRGGSSGYGFGSGAPGTMGSRGPGRGGFGGDATGIGAGGGTGNGTGGGSGGSGSGRGGGGQVLAITWGSRTPIPTGVPVRIEHPTATVFDVVVQSTSSELLTEGQETLSGRPIYMVYLPLGTAKQWILQYCEPAPQEDAPPQESRVVQLGAPSIIKAPAPVLVYKPPLDFPEDMAYLMVHGQISAKGRFHNMHIVRSASEKLDNAVLSSLEKWDFRPATQDGKPVLVEVLLAIPPDRN